MKIKSVLMLLVAAGFVTNASARGPVGGYEWADNNLTNCGRMLTSATVPQKDKNIMVVPGGTCTLSVNAAEKAMAIDAASMKMNEKEMAPLAKKAQAYINNNNDFDREGMIAWSTYSMLDDENKNIIRITQLRASKVAIVKPYIK
ncbi:MULTISPECIES: hypothetical protein [unclassified Serratia (in: enterobacteria)]|uniref:hypothetical protein n=1 Tax=unclassified Serratia (in: enterobacteria) TaxID=2647522 RepID=UPI00307631AE